MRVTHVGIRYDGSNHCALTLAANHVKEFFLSTAVHEEDKLG